MTEHTGVFTETLAMVRSDDQPGLLQYSAPIQLVHQLPKPLIEVRGSGYNRHKHRSQTQHPLGETLVDLSSQPQCWISNR